MEHDGAAWFDSPADPDLWLLRVEPERVDYWKSGAGKIVQMVAMAKARAHEHASGQGGRRARVLRAAEHDVAVG